MIKQRGLNFLMNCKMAGYSIKTGTAVLVALLLVLLISPSLYAAPIRTVEATVTKVSDGDTVQATTAEGTKLKIRLYGIDAPETEKGNKRTGRISKPGQPFGEDAKDYLTSMIFRKSVRIDVIDIDRYKRMVAVIWLEKTNVNLEMVKAGMAEAYREYLKEPYRNQFLQAEQQAKSTRTGIWSQGSSYERPSDFRKRLRIRGS